MKKSFCFISFLFLILTTSVSFASDEKYYDEAMRIPEIRLDNNAPIGYNCMEAVAYLTRVGGKYPKATGKVLIIDPRAKTPGSRRKKYEQLKKETRVEIINYCVSPNKSDGTIAITIDPDSLLFKQ